jgi:hypothetical protein
MPRGPPGSKFIGNETNRSPAPVFQAYSQLAGDAESKNLFYLRNNPTVTKRTQKGPNSGDHAGAYLLIKLGKLSTGSRCAGRSDGSRLSLDCSFTRSVKTSAWRRNSSAIIGGWLEIVETTVTRTAAALHRFDQGAEIAVARKQHDERAPAFGLDRADEQCPQMKSAKAQ